MSGELEPMCDLPSFIAIHAPTWLMSDPERLSARTVELHHGFFSGVGALPDDMGWRRGTGLVLMTIDRDSVLSPSGGLVMHREIATRLSPSPRLEEIDEVFVYKSRSRSTQPARDLRSTFDRSPQSFERVPQLVHGLVEVIPARCDSPDGDVRVTWTLSGATGLLWDDGDMLCSSSRLWESTIVRYPKMGGIFLVRSDILESLRPHMREPFWLTRPVDIAPRE